MSNLIDTNNVETSGLFIQGTDAFFYFSFPDLEGNMFDPSSVVISIINPSNIVIASGLVAEKIEEGQYAFVWSIPTNADVGLYKIIVDYVIESSTGSSVDTYEEQFVVTQKETSHYLDATTIASRGLLESMLGYCQHIKVFREPGRLNKENNVAEFSFPRWNQPAGCKVYLNGSLWTDKTTVDWMKGKVEFTNPLSKFDEITADYNFRWFTDQELDDFVAQGIQIFNQYVTQSAYQIWNLPQRYYITAIYQAAVMAIRRLMTDLMFQEPIKVFGGPENWDAIMSRWNSIKENYEKELIELYKQKKYQPYAGRTKTMIVPEYTLPGGRSRWMRYIFKGQ